ncbi:MAG: hypothetical protein PHY90_07295 [Desulfitobacteriaceae bacterium]|nr:hypothetical protein [Desulfitobacteriaceae bacterium]
MNFEYKLNNSKDVQKIELSKIEEFGIEDELKCIRALISIDMSRDRIKNIKDTLSQWEEGHAFLNVLVEGKSASLYSYHDYGTPLFFFNMEDSNIVPLVYKKYQVETTPNYVQQILYDNSFRDQLNLYLACNNQKNADRISYTKKNLVRYFEDYYKCKNGNYTTYKSIQVRDGILLLKPGVSLNSVQLGIRNLIDAGPMIYFDKENSVGFGIETEYIFPFNRYKWSVFAEANYMTYKTNNVTVGSEINPPLYTGHAIDYKSVEFPVGIKYYVNLDKNNRLFVKAAFVPYAILSESYIAFSESYREKFSSSSHLLFGFGYNYRALEMEFRYYTPTDITQNIYKRGSDLNQVTFKISYAFQLLGGRRSQ